jgi:cytochrome c oxidase cbb3-type subunit 1
MQSNAALEYDYSVAKLFTFTTILFGFLGMLIGTLIASQLAFPELNYLIGEYGTFSRLRPLHTNIVIFGFTLSGVFATFYYVGQRVLKVSMAESKFLMFIGKLHFWLYFVGALLAVLALAMGITQAKEYAQFEWPFDIVVA